MKEKAKVDKEEEKSQLNSELSKEHSQSVSIPH